VGLLDKIRDANSGDDFSAQFSDGKDADFEPDPVPGKPARSSRSAASSPAARPAPKKVTPAIKKQLADEIEAYLLLGSGAWSMRDPYCGEVLERQAREIALRLAAILGKNAQIVAWLHTTGVIGEWVSLALAIQPVLTAIKDHHISKKVSSDDEPGPDLSQFPAYRPVA
jgi:hypothetical protein